MVGVPWNSADKDGVILELIDSKGNTYPMTNDPVGTAEFTQNDVVAGIYSVLDRGVKVGDLTVTANGANTVTIKYYDSKIDLMRIGNGGGSPWTDTGSRSFALKMDGVTVGGAYPHTATNGVISAPLPVGSWTLLDMWNGSIGVEAAQGAVDVKDGATTTRLSLIHI